MPCLFLASVIDFYPVCHLTGAVALVGLFGNAIVVLIITSTRRRGQRSPVQLFLLHLAISDLLVCTVNIPLTLWVNFYYPEEDKSGASGVCKIARFVQVSGVACLISNVQLPPC